MAYKNMYEIFEEFEKATTKNDKILVLRNNYNFTLYCTLRAAFHPNIKFVVTGQVPDYTPDNSPAGLAVNTMNMVVNKMYLFEVGNPKVSPNLTLDRKKQLLIQFLEGLEAKEAVILEQVLNKSLKVKGLTYPFLKETLPELELP